MQILLKCIIIALLEIINNRDGLRIKIVQAIHHFIAKKGLKLVKYWKKI